MFKLILAIILVLSLNSCQVQKSPLGGKSSPEFKYNAQNKLISMDSHKLTYYATGKLYQIDDLNIIGENEVQGSIASTRFGGVILLSDGSYRTTFIDRHNTPKTSAKRTYSDPYGKHDLLELDIHSNHQIFGGGSSFFGKIYMGSRWYFPELKHFGAQDSENVANRYNLDKGNPVMNYDPSGHNALKEILSLGLGIDISSPKSFVISVSIFIGLELIGGEGLLIVDHFFSRLDSKLLGAVVGPVVGDAASIITKDVAFNSLSKKYIGSIKNKIQDEIESEIQTISKLTLKQIKPSRLLFDSEQLARVEGKYSNLKNKVSYVKDISKIVKKDTIKKDLNFKLKDNESGFTFPLPIDKKSQNFLNSPVFNELPKKSNEGQANTNPDDSIGETSYVELIVN